MTMAVAAAAAPGTFSFLKHGVVIPARRCGLFLKLFALNAALFFVFNIVLATGGDTSPLESGDAAASTDDDADLLSFPWASLLQRLPAPTAYLALHIAAALVTNVATASAAVAACSGERHTLVSFLRRVRGDLLGGSATVVLGLVLRAACAGAGAATVLALPALAFWGCSRHLLLLDALLAVLAFQLYFYLDVVCAMAVVVASVAADRRRRGGALAAVAQAWRAMAGTPGRAFLYAVVTMSLGVAARSVGEVAVVSRLLPPPPHAVENFEVLSVLVDGGVKYVLEFAVEVFSAVAIAAYYFECRNTKEEENKAGHAD